MHPGFCFLAAFIGWEIAFNKLNVMDRIVLEVDDSTGRLYRNLSPESRQQFCQLVRLMIKRASYDKSLAD